jgi:hypothetical protein
MATELPMFCTCRGLGLGLVFLRLFFYLAGTGVLLLFYHCNRNLGLELVSSSILTRAGWLGTCWIRLFFFKVLSAFFTIYVRARTHTHTCTQIFWTGDLGAQNKTF